MFLELKNRYCIIAVLFFLGTVLQTAPVSPMNPDEVGTVEENERPGAHKALKKLRQKYRKALEEWSSKLEVHDHPGLTSHQRAHVRLELEACEKERKRNFTLEDMDYMNSRIKQLSMSDQVEPYKSYIFDIQLLAGEDNSMRQAYLKELMLVRTKLREMQQDYRETKNWDADQLAEIRIQIEVCDEEYERSYVMALDEEFLRKRESELKTRRAALGQLSKTKRGLICLQDQKPDTTELKSGVMKATKELRKIYSESLNTWLLVLNAIKPIELSEHQRRMYRVQMEECAFQKLQLALRTYHLPYAYMNSRLKLLERNISLKDTPLETLTSKIFPRKLRVAVVDPSDLQDEGKTIENLRKELADTRKQVAERLNQGSSDTGNKEEESSLQDRERALQEKIQEHNKMHQAHEAAYQKKEEEQNQKHRDQLEEIETRRKDLDARSTAMDEEAAALNIRERELQEEINRQKMAHQECNASLQKAEDALRHLSHDQEEHGRARCSIDSQSDARSLKRLKVAFIFVCCIFLLLLFLLICLLVYQHRTHNNQGELASFKELLELHVENHDPLVGKTLNSATTSKIGSHSILLSDNEAEDSVLGDFRLP